MKLRSVVAIAAAIMTAFICVPQRATASDSSDVIAAVNGAVTAFNRGDGAAWDARCDSSAPIIDGIPPFQYMSCAQWWSSHAAYSKKNGISDEIVTLGKAWQFTVTGGRAFTAFPIGYTYKQKGKMMKTNGVLTIALRKTRTGWLTTGWSAALNMGGR